MDAVRVGETTLRWALAPFAEHLASPATSEIVVHGPGEFGVEADGWWHWYDAPELDYDRLETIAILAAHRTGKDIGSSSTAVASVLPDGERIKALVHPAVEAGKVGLAIRKRAKHFKPTLPWLAEHGYFDMLDREVDWVSYFRTWMAGATNKVHNPKRRTVVISGEIGSSKTTFTEALLYDIPLELRLVTIEGSPEWMNLPHRNWMPLYFDEADPGSATKRVQDAMQLRPDWIPFQELRGGEAWGWKRALNTGSPSVSTVHASEAAKALDSIVAMTRESPEGRSVDAADIEIQFRQRIGLVCHCTRFLPEERDGRTRYRLTEVIELGETAAEDRVVSRA